MSVCSLWQAIGRHQLLKTLPEHLNKDIPRPFHVLVKRSLLPSAGLDYASYMVKSR